MEQILANSEDQVDIKAPRTFQDQRDLSRPLIDLSQEGRDNGRTNFRRKIGGHGARDGRLNGGHSSKRGAKHVRHCEKYCDKV